MAIFRFFKTAAAAILYFRHFKFLTIGAVNRVDMLQHAEFCQNRFNRGRDILWRFVDFSKMAAVRHLGFAMRVWDHPRKAFGGLYAYAKFGWYRCSGFDNMHVFRFCEFGLKTPIHAPKLGVLGFLTP